MKKLLQKTESFLIYLLLFAFPLSVSSAFINPYVITKLAVLAFGVSLIVLVKVVRIIYEGRLELRVSKFDLPVFLLAIAYGLSAAMITPNKMEATLLPGTATLVVGSALVYFLVNQLGKESKKVAGKIFYLSASVYALVTVFSGLGVLAKLSFLPGFVKTNWFNPEGGLLPSVIFILCFVVLSVVYLIKEKDLKSRIFLGVTSLILISGLSFNVYRVLPGSNLTPQLPSYQISWYIAVDTLKASPFLGSGPGNYLTAFNRFRPISYNTTDNWNLRFSTARSFYLTALTETGLLGAVGLVMLGLILYRYARTNITKDVKESKENLLRSPYIAPLLLLILVLVLFPASVLVVFTLFVFLAMVSPAKKTSVGLQTRVKSKKENVLASGFASRIPAFLVTIPLIAAVAAVGYFGSVMLKGEYRYKQALVKLSEGDGLSSYDIMKEAINTNPLVDRYHASYSQINLILANAIAAKAQGDVTLTEQDRSNISQLVQQAIREGKSTVALNPLRASNWEVLAKTYQTIIPMAKGADAFAVQTLAQAIALDPVNPNLRISLGGLHYLLGNTETAIRVLELAVSVKPDLPNARYNLAFAYDKAGNLEAAIEQMTLVLSMVEPNTNDYETAKNALEAMEGKREVAAQQQTAETLTPPQEEVEEVIKPPLDLPEDAEPPEAPITPTPTPTDEEADVTATPGASLTPTVTESPTPTIIP